MASISFGVGVRDITPPYPVMLHGYSARDRLSGLRPEDRVSEPISARALCLEGSDGTGGRNRVLILALDAIGLHIPEATMLRREAARAAGLDARQVLLSASHTHFAPCISTQLFSPPELGIVEPDPRFLAQVTRAVAEAASQSVAALESGILETHRVPVPSVLFNRRTIVRSSGSAHTVENSFLYPEDAELFELRPVDPELTALRFTAASGPKAVLVNFGCHPVTGGPERERSHYRISADYPFYLRSTIEGSWGCPALFTLGAAGDAVPLNRNGCCREEIGSALGNAVLLGERVFTASGRSQPGEAAVATRTVEMDAKTIVSTRWSGAEDAYRRARTKVLALSGAAQAAPEVAELQEKARLAYRARLYPEDRATLEVQLVRVGETVLVGMPFEVLSEISLKLKRAFPQSVLVSIANGYEGYLPLAYEYERGGYEATPDSTHFQIGTADRLLEKALGELKTF